MNRLSRSLRLFFYEHEKEIDIKILQGDNDRIFHELRYINLEGKSIFHHVNMRRLDSCSFWGINRTCQMRSKSMIVRYNFIFVVWIFVLIN